jgi:hypothetical protein
VSDIRKSYWFPALIAIIIPLFFVSLTSDIVIAEEEIQVVRGNTITIRVTILQNGSYGDPVQNQQVHFFDQTFNSLLGSSTSNQNGIASIDWELPLDHPLGLTVLNATFKGNDSFSLSPSYQRISVLVLSHTHLEVDPIPGTLAPGDLMSFYVRLTDDSNVSVPGAEVTVFKNSLSLSTVITNTSGYASFEIECNSSWISLGENNITISYEEDLTNFLDGTEYTFIVEIAQISTYLNFDFPHPNELELDTTINLSMTLSDGNNNLSDELLEITLDEFHLSFITTNSSGGALFNAKIDERFSLGIHSLRIYYNGSIRYSQSTLDAIISITSSISINVQVYENAEIGSNLRIETTITDLLNRSLSDSILSLSDTTSGQNFSFPIEGDPRIDFQYLLQGPPGTHTLVLEILGNPFVTNNRYTMNFTAWSNNEIVLVNSGINHYASPNQEVTLEVRIIDWHGNSSSKHLHLFINSEAYTSKTTNSDGLAAFIFLAPAIEAQYNISIIYSGNISRFELATKYDYNLIVTTLMPTVIELDSYEVVAPLHQISVQLTVRGLNGSVLNGLRVNFNWLSSNLTTESFDGGLIILQLTIPSVSGSYFLYYESEPTKFVESTLGSILIEITLNDIKSTEGVGITGMVLVLGVSIGLVAVPVVRRKYLVG